VVTQTGEISLATRCGRAGRVRGTHVGGELLDNVADSHLVVDHLVLSLLLGDGAEILVRPCVTGNLVAFGDHTRDDSRPGGGSIINGTLGVVVAGDEESGLHVVRLEKIKDAVRINVGTVVESKSNISGVDARVDALATVLDVAELGTSNILSAFAIWHLVAVAARAVIDQTVRRCAVFLSVSAPSLYSYQLSDDRE
jgi:hypothetical protein